MLAMVRIYTLASVALLCSLVACSPTTPVEPVKVTSADEQNFEVMTSFYCDKQRWPQTLGEIEAWAKENARDFIAYPDAKLLNTRRIVVSIDYRKETDARTTPAAVPERRTVSFIAPPRCSAPSDDPAHVSMAGGGVQFRLTPAFRPLNRAEMQERWGAGPYPDVAWKTKEGVLISVRFGEMDLDRGSLRTLLDPLVGAYTQSRKGIRWRSKKFGKMGTTEWIRLSFESDSQKGRLYNSSFTSTFQGKDLTLALSAPIAEEKELVALSKAVLESAMIREP
jgi:hypothetical protein